MAMSESPSALREAPNLLTVPSRFQVSAAFSGCPCASCDSAMATKAFS